MNKGFDNETGLDDYSIERCTNNRLMGERVERRIRTHIEELLQTYGRTNKGTVDTYTRQLYEANYTPNQVKLIIPDLHNDFTSLPNVPEVKKYLAAKFSKKGSYKKLNQEKILQQSKRERKEFEKIKADMIERLEWGPKEFETWTKYYVKEVFGETVLDCGFIGCFQQIALKDLVKAGMDKDRAIQRGLKELGKY